MKAQGTRGNTHFCLVPCVFGVCTRIKYRAVKTAATLREVRLRGLDAVHEGGLCALVAANLFART